MRKVLFFVISLFLSQFASAAEKEIIDSQQRFIQEAQQKIEGLQQDQERRMQLKTVERQSYHRNGAFVFFFKALDPCTFKGTSLYPLDETWKYNDVEVNRLWLIVYVSTSTCSGEILEPWIGYLDLEVGQFTAQDVDKAELIFSALVTLTNSTGESKEVPIEADLALEGVDKAEKFRYESHFRGNYYDSDLWNNQKWRYGRATGTFKLEDDGYLSPPDFSARIDKIHQRLLSRWE